MSRCDEFSTARPVLILAAITLAALSSSPASAELPHHRRVVTLLPTPVESGTADDLPGEEAPNFPHFGEAVALRNGIAFVGIPFADPSSRVIIYGQTATSWQRTGVLTVSDAVIPGSRSNGFGRRITFRDGVVVIASNAFLHVFARGNGTWNHVQKIAPPARDGLATSFWNINAMRLENGILAIGSPASTGDSVAYIYELAANGKFVLRTTLKDTRYHEFGADVAVAGNTVVVGANGAALVFRRSSDGTWRQIQKLAGSDTDANDGFGLGVGIDQGMIVVGAPDQECLDTSGIFSCGDGLGPPGAGGAAYGFVPINGRYQQIFKLRPSPDQYDGYFRFGSRIAMFGKFIVVQANDQSPSGDPDFFGKHAMGLAFTYRRDGSSVTPLGITSGYVQGDSMSLANNWLLVGNTIDLTALCQSAAECFGDAVVFDLNRFAE